MPQSRLREVLNELHAELERSEAIEEGVRDELRAARDEIEQALAEEPDRAVAHATRARTRIGRAIERFEDDHPEGVALLERVLHALSNVGI